MSDRSARQSLQPQPATARLSTFGTLERSELERLAQLAGPERSLERNETLWEEGRRLPALYLLLDGWMMSTIRRPGADATTVNYHLPGDVLGLPSLAAIGAMETVTALTRVKLRPFALHSIGHLFEAHPRMAAMMFLVSLQERMILTDRLVRISTTDVRRRLAGFIEEMHARVRRSSPETGHSFPIPLSRQHVADLIGTTFAALTRALTTLRREGILGWSGHFITISDPEALGAAADLPKRPLVHNAHWLPAIEERE